MATTKRVNRRKIVKAEVAILFAFLVGVGFFLGRFTAPAKVETVTITEAMKVPKYTENPDKLPDGVGIPVYYDIPLSHSLQDFIYEECADEGVPMSLVIAMIDYESKFNPEIVSKNEDYGLMQINQINHEWLEEQYRCADMLNPYQNVFCGIKILGKFVFKYEDYGKALMAYNMGDYGARKAWENGIYTSSYSEAVLSLMKEYEQEVRGDGN